MISRFSPVLRLAIFNRLIISYLLIAFSGCFNQKSNDAYGIESYLFSELNFPKGETRYAILIPLDGCEGCIKKVVTFMRLNDSRNRIVYVLSSRSRKEIELFLSKNEIQNGSVLLDGGKAISTGLVGSFPMLYDLTKEMYSERIELNGSNADSILLRLQDNILINF